LVRKKALRKWKDESYVAKELNKYLDKKDIYTKKLISLAQAEKLIECKSSIENLWEKPEGASVLAPESDKRPAVVPAIADFLDDIKFLQ
jgi:hypothetical protein